MSYLTEFFKLVADETRFRIIVLLAQENLCVCQIYRILNLSQPKISKHLSKLRDLDYVIDERKEKYIVYSLNLKDDVIKRLVQNIVEHIDRYPQLNEDKNGLAEKDKYLRQCKIKTID